MDYKHGGEKISDLPGMPALHAPIYADLHTCLDEVEADVLLDLTTPEVGKQHVTLAVERGLLFGYWYNWIYRRRIGTFNRECKRKAVGTIIAPNFAIGAVLMMKFSQMARNISKMLR